MDTQEGFSSFKKDFTRDNNAKEVEFRRLFGELAEGQRDSVLGMEREFARAARLASNSAPLPPDGPAPTRQKTADSKEALINGIEHS